MPFSLHLIDFSLVYYPGTQTPQDFVSTLSFITKNGVQEKQISMNKIAVYKGFRFYQMGYDEDLKGTTFVISYDPYGVPITYFAYCLLLVSILLFFFEKHNHFRSLLKSFIRNQRSLFLVLLLGFSIFSSLEAQKPRVLQEKQAQDFCDLYVLYNGRVAPIQTLAKDFTMKLYGKSSYKEFSCEQVLTAWLFYYSDWAKERMFSIESEKVQDLLGIEGEYASLLDFFDARRNYKLQVALLRSMQGEKNFDKKGLQKADEKYNMIVRLRMGKLLQLYPYRNSLEKIEWYFPNSNYPSDMELGKKMFMSKSLAYLLELVQKEKWDEFSAICSKIKKYQKKELGTEEPTEMKMRAEKLYNQMDYTAWAFKLFLCLGLFSYVLILIKGNCYPQWLSCLLTVFLVFAFLYLLVFISLRAYVGGYFPASNGYETMQFLSMLSLLITIVFYRKIIYILPFGFLISGLTLLVSYLGRTASPITPLMPVLASPLLSVHVAVIMISYLLFAFICLNAITALIFHFFIKEKREIVVQFHIMSQLLLYPALFLLVIGTFIGAVWANVSWGRYWGWDPKEVWALISILIYVFPMHSSSIKRFQNPLFFHIFMIFAFLSILFTYFGVNYILGGMHSYANS